VKNSRGLEYLFSLGILAICSVVSVGLRNHLAIENFVIIYMFGVMAVSLLCSRGPALVNAVLAVVSFHYFCIPPFDSFRVADPNSAVTLAGMLAVALVTTTLTVNIRRQAAVREKAEMEVQKERTRNSLLSAVSHDLKTPLASIYGAATSLLEEEGRLTAPQRHDLAQSISSESERLNRLLTNLLEMTRLDSGRKLSSNWHPLEEILGAALTQMERALRPRTVNTDIPSNLPLVFVDDVLLEQVFVNLLENAVKYTPQGMPISVSAHAERGQIEVTVIDGGPGFAADDVDHVFEKFFRGKVEGVRGVGLGLAICKAIIELHEGTISATNVGTGGACIRFTLPVGGVPPELREISESNAV
jgi:K+-sensing histidine kinase KdpD